MAKTLLIGLDGATFTVLSPLVAAGDMPCLGRLMAQGAHAELASTTLALTPQAWTSMITGRSPGWHGVFDFVHGRQTPDGYYFTLNMSYDIRCPTLWSIASRKGLGVANLNFPVAYPPEPINGVCIPGFVHARHLRISVHPPGLYERLERLPGFDPELLAMDMGQELQSIQHLPPEAYEPWIAHHTRREDHWFRVIEWVMRETAPDLLAIVFDGVDKLQHLCWRLLDPNLTPAAPTPWEARIRALCLDYFRRLDAIIGRIGALAGPDARLFLASDHGFGPTEIVFFVNAWLAEKGYLAWAKTSAAGASTRIATDPIKNHVEGIDWRNTVAYGLTPSSNGIHIRRAADGSPGMSPSDYATFRERLAGELRAVVHPRTGAPFFRQVLTREEAFPGDAAERAPDLTLIMQDYGFQSVLNSDRIFRERSEYWGTHYPDGVFIACGPGIAPFGRMPRMSIVDVAPVLLRSLGVSTDAVMDGRCPEGLFDPLAEGDVSPVDAPGHAAGEPAPRARESRPEVAEDVLKLLVQLDYFQEN